ncbi:MAG: permease, partial [Rhodobacteraceae bacterium]
MADISQQAPKGASPIIARLKTAWSISFALLLGVAVLDPANLGSTIIFAARALASTAPYIVFAVLLLAYLKATGAEVMVARAFVGREVRMIFLAALFGGLAPFCSCEVIPFV